LRATAASDPAADPGVTVARKRAPTVDAASESRRSAHQSLVGAGLRAITTSDPAASPRTRRVQ